MGLDQFIYKVENSNVDKYIALRKKENALKEKLDKKMEKFSTAFKDQFADEINELSNKLVYYNEKYDVLIEERYDDIAAKIYNGLSIAEHNISVNDIEWFLFNDFSLIILWDEDKSIKEKIKKDFISYYITLTKKVYEKLKNLKLFDDRNDILELEKKIENIIDDIDDISIMIVQFRKNQTVHEWIDKNVSWDDPKIISKLISMDQIKQMINECENDNIVKNRLNTTVNNDCKYYYFAW